MHVLLQEYVILFYYELFFCIYTYFWDKVLLDSSQLLHGWFKLNRWSNLSIPIILNGANLLKI